MHIGLVYDQKAINDLSKEELNSPPPFILIAYANSNFAGDPEVRKSVIRYCFFMAGALVSWSSKKQRTVLNSTNEAE